MELFQNTETEVVFFLSDATDNETPETGKAGTTDTYIRKGNGSFVATTNDPTEVGRGWYRITLTADELDTLGSLVFEAESSGANIWREVHRINRRTADAILADDDADTLADLIADHVLRRNISNTEAGSDGDTQDFQSLYGAVAKIVNDWSVSSNLLTVYETDGTTTVGTQTLTPNSGADPVVGASTN